MGTACCREKGVPDTCFGYCAKECYCLKNKKQVESRRITGTCQEWFEVIAKCRGSNYNTPVQSNLE